MEFEMSDPIRWIAYDYLFLSLRELFKIGQWDIGLRWGGFKVF